MPPPSSTPPTPTRRSPPPSHPPRAPGNRTPVPTPRTDEGRTAITPWRLRRNPLRRRTDLFQAWLGLVLLPTVLAAAPVAAYLAADAAHRHYTHTADRHTQIRRHTTAVLVQDAPRHPEPGSAEEKNTRYPAEVRFTDAGGRTRNATTDVPPGLRAGSTVHVWADAHGGIHGPPLTPDQIRSRTMGWAILAALSVIALGSAGYGAVTLVVHRRNLAAWATAWSGTAPRWTTPK
ncbi:Rv1733c family protein [Streptomyces spiralis]|uniref:Rv1733c family protein n=1 Tax=Streptomyces spiralis TaxID=66376 RepID=UPI003F4D1B83